MAALNLRDMTTEQQLTVIEQSNPELKALLEVYPPEELDKLMSKKKKLAKIAETLSNGITVHASINSMIMTCTRACPFRNVCILAQSEVAPDGYACPIEKKIVAELHSDIVASLEIDTNDPIEMDQVWDLIELRLLDLRGSGKLKDGSLVQVVEQKIGQAVSTREEVSPTLEMKLELKKLKHQIIDSFVGTRRAKKKYGMNTDSNTIEQMILRAAQNANTK